MKFVSDPFEKDSRNHTFCISLIENLERSKSALQKEESPSKVSSPLDDCLRKENHEELLKKIHELFEPTFKDKEQVVLSIRQCKEMPASMLPTPIPDTFDRHYFPPNQLTYPKVHYVFGLKVYDSAIKKEYLCPEEGRFYCSLGPNLGFVRAFAFGVG
jgi:hypothetical protein